MKRDDAKSSLERLAINFNSPLRLAICFSTCLQSHVVHANGIINEVLSLRRKLFVPRPFRRLIIEYPVRGHTEYFEYLRTSHFYDSHGNRRRERGW